MGRCLAQLLSQVVFIEANTKHKKIVQTSMKGLGKYGKWQGKKMNACTDIDNF